MRHPRQDDFRNPWNVILGSESQVRALRVLDEADEPMSVRELARRTKMHLRAMQLAVEKLQGAGILERVGTGSRPQVRLRRSHPLAGAVIDLFHAERSRVERILEDLKTSALEHGRRAEAIWVEEPVASGHEGGEDTLRIGVLAPSDQIDAVVDDLRERMGALMRREDVTVEVRGWTRTDLETIAHERRPALEIAIPLLGTPPGLVTERAPAKRTRLRSHADIDAELRDRGRRIAHVLARKPELVGQAREEITKRLATAAPQEARTLREWQQLLEGLSLRRLQRWLIDSGEQATRLRQSMPVAFLKAASGPNQQGRRYDAGRA
jgi:DNA-binding IclR family transcriptional regulator